MPITRTTMIDDDGSGTTGTILNNAWKQELYGQIDQFVGGALVDVPFNAANYTASAGLWTVTAPNQQILTYSAVGNLVQVYFAIVGNSTITAAPTFLYLTIPGLPAAIRQSVGTFHYWVGGNLGVGVVEITSGTRIQFYRDISGPPWPSVAASTCYLLGGLSYAYR